MLSLNHFKSEIFSQSNAKKVYEFIDPYNKFYNIPFNYFLRATLKDPGHNEDLNLIIQDVKTQEIVAVFLSTLGIIDNIQKCVIKVFAVRKDYRRKGLGSAVLNDIINKCRAKNVPFISYGASPPRYWEPGLDIRNTDLYFFLIKHKFRERGLRFNLTVDLLSNEYKPSSQFKSYKILRATTQDLEELYNFIKNNFPSQVWPEEVKLSFDFDPPTTYIAKDSANKIIGWATHSNFYPGSFGPTGVLNSLHKQGIGKELLYWCLQDIKSSGLNSCIIMWVTGDTRKFYTKAVEAYIHPIYYVLEKKIK